MAGRLPSSGQQRPGKPPVPVVIKPTRWLRTLFCVYSSPAVRSPSMSREPVMMKVLPVFALAVFALAVVAATGCASMSAGPGGLPAGKFVTMTCSDNKSFQARLSDDGRTVRVRTHHGAAELDRQADGRFAGEGYVLNLNAEGGAALEHGGKSQGKGCKPAT